jgi:hypothetical protein
MAVIDEAALTAAKIRDMPISDALRRVLLVAAQEAGVEIVRITSGGQPGSRGQRTGSNRHDGGNAADLELVARGRTLDFTQSSDLDTICRFVASAAACGATGIGAGVKASSALPRASAVLGLTRFSTRSTGFARRLAPPPTRGSIPRSTSFARLWRR